MDGKFIAYYRVSTDHQGVNGNGMAAQRKAVEDYLNGGRWKLVGEFTEVESGKRSDRPELEKALTACRKHKAACDREAGPAFPQRPFHQRPDGAQGRFRGLRYAERQRFHDQRLCRGGARGTPHDQRPHQGRPCGGQGARRQARRPATAPRRLEFHYTPKHARWLNMVEIEIGVLRSQCLDRRIDTKEQLESEIATWECQRNASGARIKWMFTTDKARAKMGRAYPQLASVREAQAKKS